MHCSTIITALQPVLENFTISSSYSDYIIIILPRTVKHINYTPTVQLDKN